MNVMNGYTQAASRYTGEILPGSGCNWVVHSVWRKLDSKKPEYLALIDQGGSPVGTQRKVIPYTAIASYKNGGSSMTMRQVIASAKFYGEEPVKLDLPKAEINVYETQTVLELAQRMGLKASELVRALFNMNVMATVNQAIGREHATNVVEALGHSAVQKVQVAPSSAAVAAVAVAQFDDATKIPTTGSVSEVFAFCVRLRESAEKNNVLATALKLVAANL